MQSALANQDAQIHEAQPEKVSVLAKSLRAKYGNKNEEYRFLTVDAKVYLPHKEGVTVWFMGDLIAGRKKRK